MYNKQWLLCTRHCEKLYQQVRSLNTTWCIFKIDVLEFLRKKIAHKNLNLCQNVQITWGITNLSKTQRVKKLPISRVSFFDLTLFLELRQHILWIWTWNVHLNNEAYVIDITIHCGHTYFIFFKKYAKFIRIYLMYHISHIFSTTLLRLKEKELWFRLL